MITTVTIKQKLREVFEVGSGPTNILVLGSCRCVPYINYLDRYNRSAGEPFKIYAIEPNNYHWDEHDNPANFEEELVMLQADPRVLSIIKSTNIFIHEYYANFGMFNTGLYMPKNIYQFGIKPDMDISIPNFHDRFILFNDYADCGIVAPEDYIAKGEEAVEGFCEVCRMSSFPEFDNYFREKWRQVRFFWRPNHISAAFSLYIFMLMNNKFLKLPLTHEFWQAAAGEDLFKEPHTQVTQRDIEGYKLTWH